jgi:hypothetical protein
VTTTLGAVDTADWAVELDVADPAASVSRDAGTVVEAPLLGNEDSSADVHATAPISRALHPRFRQPLEAITSV